MWFKEYRDYPIDTTLIKEKTEPNLSMVGCEMHDINGWGNDLHIPRSQKKGLIRNLLSYLFKGKPNNG